MLADWDSIAGQARKKQECKGYISDGSMEFTFSALVLMIFLAGRSMCQEVTATLMRLKK